MIKKVSQTAVEGCFVLEYDRFDDKRGSFQEMHNSDEMLAIGLPYEFEQSNITQSNLNVLRGLHLQKRKPQGKLVQCHQGIIFDVCVDLRFYSQTFMKWHGQKLSMYEPKAMFIPPGCAHGFLVTNIFSASPAIVSYLCTETYDASSDGGILWSDTQIGINWPIRDQYDVIVSPKDAKLPTMREYLKALE